MKWLALVFVLLFSSPAIASDVQSWDEIKATYKLGDNQKLKITNELRFSLEERGLFYHHLDIGIEHKMPGFKWFKLGTNGRLIQDDKVEWRSHLNFTFHYKVGWVKAANRTRLELRLQEGDFKWRTRNRMRLELDFLFGSNLFAQEELIFDRSGLIRTRLAYGAAVKVETITLSSYYMLQTAWPMKDHIHVLGMSIGLSF